ncbi:Glycosyltransferase [Archaeoglobus sulfaticallidus PM70-1]|uniref:Glycosyltransferase n=1 Tax=Archaeoglobus sulfaticallidus PM70-1 TaxID=387631 RepID=N0B8Y2_9EURY|nr:glycosyltransferase family 4 protein [Archaeoglobus sulfaticallidus]AGK60069.1 Glycosyltransferase [Archaeoglobus sulfaticallidus PM70-1]
MKVCLIGDFSSNLDEGFKNIAQYLAKELSKYDDLDILKANIKEIKTLKFWKKIKMFHPTIVHYIPGPTYRSFLFVNFLLYYLNYRDHSNPKIIMSTPYPKDINRFIKSLPRKPDLILAQSNTSKRMFKSLGLKTIYVPNGVDFEKFKPVPSHLKKKLRVRYNIDEEKFTILHVGHLTKKRNLKILGELARMGNQVIIVSSEYLKVEKNIIQTLQKTGCIIFRGYFEHIEEFYQMSDCYIFPVLEGDTILFPLSVIEAMACNLPVLTRKFDGLSIFNEGEGLIFVEKETEIIQGVEKIKKNGDIRIATRRKVTPYSWKNIAQRLREIYYKLVEETI